MNLYKTIGIYGIKNKINGNIYVGKTAMNFGDRRDSHYSLLNNNKHKNQHLQRAWNKYGSDNFEFVILHELQDGEDINALEISYIEKYKKLGLSYNIAPGGEGGNNLGKHLSAETKRKIGEKNRIHMTGRHLSNETKKKMSESTKKHYQSMTEDELIEFGKKSSKYASGYKWSEKSKENFSKIQRTKPNGAKYDVDIVKEIRRLHEKENKGYTEISEELNIPRPAVYLIATYRRWKHVS